MTIRRWLHICLCLTLTAALAGCSAYERKMQNSSYDYGSRLPGDPKALGGRMYGSTTGNPNQHDNKWFEYSSLVSREVSRLDGVSAAIVMLTDKNAYVGLMLDWSAVGTINSGGDQRKDQNMGGMGDGVYDNDTGSPYWNGSQLATPYNSYFTVNDHQDLSTELKQTVAARVRGLAPRVQEVHISANMDFVNELNEYTKEAWGGRPLEPWIEEFNVLVKHQFAGGKIMPQPLRILKAQRAADQNSRMRNQARKSPDGSAEMNGANGR